MIALLTTHKILNKSWIKGLVYRTRSSVIFTAPGLPGFLGRGLFVYYVFGRSPKRKMLEEGNNMNNQKGHPY